MARVLALMSRDPGFKTCSDQGEFYPGSPRFNFSAALVNLANWFASGQLEFLTVVVVVALFCH